MLENLTIRHFRAEPDDIPALARLLAETPEFAASGDDFSEQALRAAQGPGFEPERDRWVVEVPAAAGHSGPLAGYAALYLFPNSTRADLLVAVHPDWRRRGLGRALLGHALTGAQARGALDANAYVDEADAGASAFARATGFAPVAAYTRLTAPGATPFPAPAFPPGYTARACRGAEDYERFIESANTCYAGLWGHNPVSEEAGRDWFAGLDPSGVCFLFGPDGALVGRASAQRAERDGTPIAVVDAPGVIPALRHAGLYAPLALWATAWAARQPGPAPARYIMDSWGDDPTVINSYQNLGFTLDRRETSWRLPLPRL